MSQAKSYQIVWSAGRFPFERPSGIPDTGQTQCYDNEKEIPCPNPGENFYGQDASYNINSQSFTKLDAQGNELPDSANEWTIVRDNITGLIWEVKTDDGSIHDKDNTYEWHDIETVFIKTLNDQQFAGVSDWRMPTIKELDSIADYGKYNPAIDSRFFPSTKFEDESLYWSSTSWAGYIAVNAWAYSFRYGGLDIENKDLSHYVRAVRGGQQAIFPECVDNGDSTVTDLNTGLMWQQATNSEMNWENAIKYCENLSLADFSDWRLPSRKELRSIVNYNKYSPSIDTVFFPETMPNRYLSSTSSHHFADAALGIHFSQGSNDANKDSSDYIFVRAVRGGQNRLLGHLFIGSPQQSSTWQPGNSMPIKWLTQNISGNVSISISREGGKADTFVSIANNTPNDGEFEWTVPNTPSVNCMLKVVPVNAPEKGTTQGLFTILPPQPSNLSFEQTELTLHHMVQTMYTVSDPDSKKLTIVAFSSDPMLVPDTSINLGNGSNNYPIDLTPGEPVSLSLTCYQADKNYGQAIITVEVYDENSLSTTQQITVSVTPFHSLTCENCEITQTMGMVSAGGEHYLALKPDRTVVAWGVNEYGQLGTGDTKKE
ncbi:MAG: hypothetical protein OMM_02547 [Candidatus Magnetoglobus multicellularis str. Araruama]|uniref:Lcl C-terminal domain-containing protein n=1 Tax=Candidatus Magnetoglobus multicellularis str. Araruama TaxID=890399 RepID=A0A1V1P994_9BACT|nr:MAG: hypothetical protein OMM_02547 [Candidatus Magnetoglobus multicellularis str. Araruama]